ncbi:hypothetical protein B0H14DRAFT_2851827 [Mycena olivaceomarginata]|nr:hypothetical protein B0H14DRAFT_2851827 [Mycena olivaceomarginata]
MDNAHPSVPLELERIVFELAAELYPETIPSLLLVAARVLQWIEPLRYRTFTLTGTHQSALSYVFSSRQSSQNLPSSSTTKFGTCAQPRVFTKIHWPISFPSAPDYDRYLRPRGHGGFLPRFDTFSMPGAWRPSIYTAYVLSSLTHLDVFDIVDADIWSEWSGLAPLPLLTHLAFIDLDDTVVANILATCPKLLVLVSMHGDGLALRSAIADRDPRFVSMVLSTQDYVLDWQTGIRGGMDFWARADAFVAKKRRGEIEPKSRHWIEDGDGI